MYTHVLSDFAPPIYATIADMLKRPRYLWRQSELPHTEQAGFAELLKIDLKTVRSWAYKEHFVEFWVQPDAAQGLDFVHPRKRSVMFSRLTSPR